MNLIELTQKYADIPYKLGGKSMEEGFDCFSLFLKIG
ncbi:unnamed protein product, partial [marine sediment metagenome]